MKLSTSEMAAMSRIRSSGRSRGRDRRKTECLTYPLNKIAWP